MVRIFDFTSHVATRLILLFSALRSTEVCLRTHQQLSVHCTIPRPNLLPALPSFCHLDIELDLEAEEIAKEIEQFEADFKFGKGHRKEMMCVCLTGHFLEVVSFKQVFLLFLRIPANLIY